MRDSASPGFDMSLADALKGPLVTWQVFPN
jgi:hypothetical protein